jgi:hypothetical protein
VAVDADKVEAGGELDARVAQEVMQWHRDKIRTDRWADAGGGLQGFIDAWSPSRNPAAMWQVVEHLDALGYSIDIDNIENPPEKWVADIRPDREYRDRAEGDRRGHARGATAMVAVCRAALTAKALAEAAGRRK